MTTWFLWNCDSSISLSLSKPAAAKVSAPGRRPERAQSDLPRDKRKRPVMFSEEKTAYTFLHFQLYLFLNFFPSLDFKVGRGGELLLPLSPSSPLSLFFLCSLECYWMALCVKQMDHLNFLIEWAQTKGNLKPNPEGHITAPQMFGRSLCWSRGEQRQRWPRRG